MTNPSQYQSSLRKATTALAMNVGQVAVRMEGMTAENEQYHRQQIVEQCKWLSANRFNQLTSGNISVRLADNSTPAPCRSSQTNLKDQPSPASPPESTASESFLITPSGKNYACLIPEMIVRMNANGDWEGDHPPSSEWRFHADILTARPEIQAVVHTHSMFATVQSMTRQTIPACHYLISMLGGSDVRCAPYARFGSQQLSDYAVTALEGRMACLLANHGAIALGTSLQQAVDNAVLLETLSKQYFFAKLAGVVLLTEEEIIETREALHQLPHYGSG